MPFSKLVDDILQRYCAGAISEETAIGIAYLRGIWASKLPELHRGLQGMLAVALSATAVQPFLKRLQENVPSPAVEIACINGPKSITLSGDKTQLELIGSWLKEAQYPARQLRVNVAYHSSFMKIIEKSYLRSLQSLDWGPVQATPIPIISSVTGGVVPLSTISTPEYWVKNLVSQVKFHSAISTICVQSAKAPRKQLGTNPQSLSGISDLMEIGPHSTLQGPISDILAEHKSREKISYLSALNRQVDPVKTTLEATGRLWTLGYNVDLLEANGLWGRPVTVCTDLPEYLFDHTQRHWFEGRASAAFRFRSHPPHELLGSWIATSTDMEARWRNFISLDTLPWVRDHQVSVFRANRKSLLIEIDQRRLCTSRCSHA